MAGARVVERCDCRRSKTHAPSSSEVLPRPFGPTMKLKPGPNSTVFDSKQRKLRSCRSRSIKRSQTNEFEPTRHLRCSFLPRIIAAVDRRHVRRFDPDRGGDEIV